MDVSAKGLARGRPFAQALGDALVSNRLDASRIALQVSERSLHFGGDVGSEILDEVARLGVALTVDEFGVGQSSLAALRRMPVSKLKIDARLVADIAKREDAAVIVRTAIAVGTGLGLSVAADGVETEAHLAGLRAAGCEEWQGGLFSEPLDADSFRNLLTTFSRAASA
jgi:EAL domain-containing protein (putative c-di-GMP-specific phosphodiesterase class I)